jgi:hypothetical protein
LAAILLPPFPTHREKARLEMCATHQKQIVTAILVYAQDHGGTLPASATLWTDLILLDETTRCPNRSVFPNGYVYNNRLSGKRIGDPRLGVHDGLMVTADGHHQDPAYGESANVAYSAEDLDFRHNGEHVLVASFLDGHVATATPAQTAGWLPPAPPKPTAPPKPRTAP